jgi:polar amino acid transport system substrate-binding protein
MPAATGRWSGTFTQSLIDFGEVSRYRPCRNSCTLGLVADVGLRQSFPFSPSSLAKGDDRKRKMEMRDMNRCHGLVALKAALVVMAFLHVSMAWSGEKMRFAIGNFQPYFSDDMPEKGAIAVVVRAAMAASDVDVEFDFYPWSRALEMAKRGEVAGSPGWTRTPERDADFIFSEPFVNCVDGVFFLKDKPLAFSSVKDFRGRRIGVIVNLTYGAEFADGLARGDFRVEAAPASENLVRMLLLGRVDAVVLNRSVAAQVLAGLSKEEAERIQASDTPFLLKPWRLAVGKSHPEAKKIIAAFDAGLSKIRRNGSYRRLMSDPAFGLASQIVP